MRGEGEPVLLMHCGFVAQVSAPPPTEAALIRRYQLMEQDVSHGKQQNGGGHEPGQLRPDEQQALPQGQRRPGIAPWSWTGRMKPSDRVAGLSRPSMISA